MNRFNKPVLLITFCIALILSCPLLFMACDKSAVAGPPDEPGKPLLIELILEDSGTITKETFTYNSKNLLVQVIDSTWAKSRPDERWLVRRTEYQWKNKELSKILFYGDDNDDVEAAEFIGLKDHQLVVRYKDRYSLSGWLEFWKGFDDKGRLIADTIFENRLNRIATYDLYRFDDNNNTLTDDAYGYNGNGSYSNFFSTTYTYDQKKNPFHLEGRATHQMGFNIGLTYPGYIDHNILTAHYVNKTDGTNTFVTYSYTYNEHDLPVTRTVQLNGKTQVLTYRYK